MQSWAGLIRSSSCTAKKLTFVCGCDSAGMKLGLWKGPRCATSAAQVKADATLTKFGPDARKGCICSGRNIMRQRMSRGCCSEIVSAPAIACWLTAGWHVCNPLKRAPGRNTAVIALFGKLVQNRLLRDRPIENEFARAHQVHPLSRYDDEGGISHHPKAGPTGWAVYIGGCGRQHGLCGSESISVRGGGWPLGVGGAASRGLRTVAEIARR